MFYKWIGFLCITFFASLFLLSGEAGSVKGVALFILALMIVASFGFKLAFNEGRNQALESERKKAKAEEEESKIRRLVLEKIESEKSKDTN